MQLLEITDGTTTLDFLDMAGNYSLENEGWRPTVPNKRMSQLGGNGSYESVRETMGLLVRPATGGLSANEALVQLRLLMEQAERWGMGDTTVAPVRLRFQLEADAFPQENVIVGASGNAAIMTLPPQHVDLPLGTISHPVTLDFERRGDWLFYPEIVNYVENGSFETWDGSNFSGWTKFSAPITYEQSSSYVKFGQKSARLVFSSIASDGLYQDVITATSGNFVASTWVYVVSGTLRLYLSDGGGFSSLTFVDSSGTGWQRLQLARTGAVGGIRITLVGVASGNESYIDGVVLQSGLVATDWVPSLSSFIVESTAATIPSVHTLAWDSDAAGEGFDNPTDLGALLQSATPSTTALNSTIMSGVIALADAVNKIELVAADTITNAAPWSTTSGATDDAYGGDILRTDAAGVTGYKAVFASLDTLEAQVFITAKATDTRIYGVRVIGATDDAGATAVGNTVYVEGDTVVSIVNLGKIRLAKTFIKNIALEVVSVGGSGAGYIAFDTVLLVAVDSGTAALSLLKPTEMAGLGGTIAGVNSIEAVLETGQLPEAYLANVRATMTAENTDLVTFYEGLPLQAFGSVANKFRSNTIYGCIVAVPNATAKWRIVDFDDVPVQAIFTATRAIANLLPN